MHDDARWERSRDTRRSRSASPYEGRRSRGRLRARPQTRGASPGCRPDAPRSAPHSCRHQPLHQSFPKVTRFSPDSSCIVAGALAAHPDHSGATQEVLRRIARGERLILLAHTLAETFSTLTRMPAPDRLAPSAALRVIDSWVAAATGVHTLSPDGYLHAFRACVDLGRGGGLVYDGLILATAEEAGVDVLLTFNRRHFLPLAAGSLVRIVTPRTDAEVPQ